MNLIDSFRERLPNKYVDLIVNNSDDPDGLNSYHFLPIESELMSLFDWHESNEGYEFWNEVHLFLIGITNSLPVLPIDISYKPDTIFLCDDHLYIMNIGGTGACLRYPSKHIKPLSKGVKEKIFSFLN